MAWSSTRTMRTSPRRAAGARPGVRISVMMGSWSCGAPALVVDQGGRCRRSPGDGQRYGDLHPDTATSRAPDLQRAADLAGPLGHVDQAAVRTVEIPRGRDPQRAPHVL